MKRLRSYITVLVAPQCLYVFEGEQELLFNEYMAELQAQQDALMEQYEQEQQEPE